ncbi:MAG TPA: GNAT family N-acetyltransferase [Terracidiphilus sp.]|jgi:aminoglycoside 6'-N-acetyltransferase I
MHTVRRAELRDRDELAQLHLLLWPECELDQEKEQVMALLTTGKCGTLPAAVFVADAGDGALAGFIEVGMRSHADGCNVAHPVGFIEGWFVRQANRNHGVGRSLMRAAEQWARSHDCAEIASDALIDNEDSHRAHTALGYEVVDRCVHFRKSL